jgi:hypothetical protein
VIHYLGEREIVRLQPALYLVLCGYNEIDRDARVDAALGNKLCMNETLNSKGET